MAQRLSLGAKSQQRREAMFRSSQPQLIKSRASSPEWGKLLTCLKVGMITVLKIFYLFIKWFTEKSKNKYLKQKMAINFCGGGGKTYVDGNMKTGSWAIRYERTSNPFSCDYIQNKACPTKQWIHNKKRAQRLLTYRIFSYKTKQFRIFICF